MFQVFLWNYSLFFRFIAYVTNKFSNIKTKKTVFFIFCFVLILLHFHDFFHTKPKNYYEILKLPRNFQQVKFDEKYKNFMNQMPKLRKDNIDKALKMKKIFKILNNTISKKFYDKFNDSREYIPNEKVEIYVKIGFSALYHCSNLVLGLFMSTTEKVKPSRKWISGLVFAFFSIELNYIFQDYHTKDIFDSLSPSMSTFDKLNFLRYLQILLMIAMIFAYKLFYKDITDICIENINEIKNKNQEIKNKGSIMFGNYIFNEITSSLSFASNFVINEKNKRSNEGQGFSFMKSFLYYCVYMVIYGIAVKEKEVVQNIMEKNK